METFDKSTGQEPTFHYAAQVRRKSGNAFFEDEEVQVEHTLDVYIGSVLAMRIVCTPDHLVDLVIGRLFTEGIIKSADDVQMVYMCEYATKARVLLNRKVDLEKVNAPVVPSCCTGNKVFSAIEANGADMVPVRPIPWKPEWVFNLADRFAHDTPMHRRTYGAHSCFLAVGDQILYCCEDLGRHNAFDKVIGCALRAGTDLTQAIIYTSGRLPVDMVTKAIKAGVPILVSKAVPTDLTIELARRFDLTLVCAARPDSMKVYHDPAWEKLPETGGEWKVPRLFDAEAEVASGAGGDEARAPVAQAVPDSACGGSRASL